MIPAIIKPSSISLVFAASLLLVAVPVVAQISIPFDLNFSGGSAAPDRPAPEPMPPPAAPALHGPVAGQKRVVPSVGARKRHRRDVRSYTLRGL